MPGLMIRGRFHVKQGPYFFFKLFFRQICRETTYIILDADRRIRRIVGGGDDDRRTFIEIAVLRAIIQSVPDITGPESHFMKMFIQRSVSRDGSIFHEHFFNKTKYFFRLISHRGLSSTYFITVDTDSLRNRTVTTEV